MVPATSMRVTAEIKIPRSASAPDRPHDGQIWFDRWQPDERSHPKFEKAVRKRREGADDAARRGIKESVGAYPTPSSSGRVAPRHGLLEGLPYDMKSDRNRLDRRRFASASGCSAPESDSPPVGETEDEAGAITSTDAWSTGRELEADLGDRRSHSKRTHATQPVRTADDMEELGRDRELRGRRHVAFEPADDARSRALEQREGVSVGPWEGQAPTRCSSYSRLGERWAVDETMTAEGVGDRNSICNHLSKRGETDGTCVGETHQLTRATLIRYCPRVKGGCLRYPTSAKIGSRSSWRRSRVTVRRSLGTQRTLRRDFNPSVVAQTITGRSRPTVVPVTSGGAEAPIAGPRQERTRLNAATPAGKSSARATMRRPQ